MPSYKIKKLGLVRNSKRKSSAVLKRAVGHEEKGAMREHKYNAKSKRYDTRNKIQHRYMPKMRTTWKIWSFPCMLKLSQMYIHFKQVRIISITKFLFYISNNGEKSETQEITIEDSCLSF